MKARGDAAVIAPLLSVRYTCILCWFSARSEHGAPIKDLGDLGDPREADLAACTAPPLHQVEEVKDEAKHKDKKKKKVKEVKHEWVLLNKQKPIW